MRTRIRILAILGSWALLVGSVLGDDTADRTVAFGDYLFRQGDYYRAITEYERFLFLASDDPRRNPVRLKIGAAYYRGEKWEAAGRQFQELRAKAGNTESGRQAGLYLSAIALRQKDYGRALNYMEEFIAAHPADPRRDAVMTELILTHLRRQEAADAGRLLEAEIKAGETGVKVTAADLDEWRDRSQKSPRLAGALSAVLPGAGQGYVGRWSDATLAFVVNGVFIWGTVAAFDRDEDVAGSFLLAMEATWYFGNIYNAVNGAQKVNRATDERFFDTVKIRYGLTFPPDGGDNLIPVVGVSGTF
jgi:tetratricopeptide (TPR) repeat protein